jgi:hypothetical protein
MSLRNLEKRRGSRVSKEANGIGAKNVVAQVETDKDKRSLEGVLSLIIAFRQCSHPPARECDGFWEWWPCLSSDRS